MKAEMRINLKYGWTYVGFEAVTAVDMKSSVFSDIKPCSLLKSQLTFQRNLTVLYPTRLNSSRADLIQNKHSGLLLLLLVYFSSKYMSYIKNK
jgi:hypothetical protein